MKEIEVKIIDINRSYIENKLLELGAEKIFDDEIDAIILDDDNKTFFKKNELLRLRYEGKKGKLTLKKKTKDSSKAKVFEELEVEVSDIEELKKIFENLGYNTSFKMRKHRTSYSINNVHFEFDKYLDEFSFIPEFLEIEGPNENTIFYYAQKLGFSKEDCKAWTAKDLEKHYKNKSL